MVATTSHPGNTAEAPQVKIEEHKLVKAPHEANREHKPVNHRLRQRKKWTVMIYLAADTTLTNFAVESLKQMKASVDDTKDYINVVAELDFGQFSFTERYFFGDPADSDIERHAQVHFLEKPLKPEKIIEQMIDPLSSISNNIVMQPKARNAGDPATLTNFIDSSVREYPAEHYFLIIWGHGSGIDDSFPGLSGQEVQVALRRDQSDRFFIPRHRPLHTANLEPESPELKSVAFVDRPISFLTNAGLKKALQDAQESLSGEAGSAEDDSKKPAWTLDLLGMDACNMNLIELGYELREFADYMVASQDEIPNASWPYDHILRELASTVGKMEKTAGKKNVGKYADHEMQHFVREIAKAFTGAYQDYVRQPVALSAVNLSLLRNAEVGAKMPDNSIRSIFEPLTNILEKHSVNREINDAIILARRNVRSFYTRIPATREMHNRDIYIDLIHFCELLQRFLREDSLRHKIKAFIENFTLVFPSEKEKNGAKLTNDRRIIAVNETSRNEENCYGTSIYFPASPQDAFPDSYGELEFAHATLWAKFVESFLDKNPQLFMPLQSNLKDPQFWSSGNGNGHGNGRMTKGNANDGTKGNANDSTKGNANDSTKRFQQLMLPPGLPLNGNHRPEESTNLTIYNIICNYDEVHEPDSEEAINGG